MSKNVKLNADTATSTAATEKPAKAKKAHKPAKKAAAKPSSNGSHNLSLEEARLKVLKALCKKELNRNELKAVAPYGNYTGLMNGLVADGMVKEIPNEERAGRFYMVLAKGKAAATK